MQRKRYVLPGRCCPYCRRSSILHVCVCVSGSCVLIPGSCIDLPEIARRRWRQRPRPAPLRPRHRSESTTQRCIPTGRKGCSRGTTACLRIDKRVATHLQSVRSIPGQQHEACAMPVATAFLHRHDSRRTRHTTCRNARNLPQRSCLSSPCRLSSTCLGRSCAPRPGAVR